VGGEICYEDEEKRNQNCHRIPHTAETRNEFVNCVGTIGREREEALFDNHEGKRFKPKELKGKKTTNFKHRRTAKKSSIAIERNGH